MFYSVINYQYFKNLLVLTFKHMYINIFSEIILNYIKYVFVH